MFLSSQAVSSWLQWCFHNFCMFPGQSSACYLVREMRPHSHAFPLPSCGSISCLHFPKVISSHFNQNLYNTDFPNAPNRLSTERKVIDCYCCICLYYQKSIFKVLANPHIHGPVEHTIKRWPLGIYRVK